MIIEVNGREHDFQEFCDRMASAFRYLAKSALYQVDQISTLEGMRVIWALYEIRGNRKVQIGPQLTYSNLKDAWVEIEGAEDEPIFIKADQRSSVKLPLNKHK